MSRLQKLRNGFLPLLAVGLLALLMVWVALAPDEARLGNLVKLVYVHGALVWVGLVTFSVAGGLGLVALVVRRPMWYHGTWAAGLAALVIWIVYIVSAMAVTGLTWGQMIAWNESHWPDSRGCCGSGHRSPAGGRRNYDSRFHRRGKHGDGDRALGSRAAGRGHPPSSEPYSWLGVCSHPGLLRAHCVDRRRAGVDADRLAVDGDGTERAGRV